MEKVLGKILSAKYGKIHDYPMFIGLQLSFSLSDGGCVGDGGKLSKSANGKKKTKARHLSGLLQRYIKSSMMPRLIRSMSLLIFLLK